MDGQLDTAFAALADGTRRALVARLTIGDATVGELAAPFPVSLQAISKHIAVLEAAGLVTKGRDGTRRLVHLEAHALGSMTSWIEHHQRQAEGRFQRLDAVLDELRAADADAATASDTTTDTGARADRQPPRSHPTGDPSWTPPSPPTPPCPSSA